jgi:hypothetical protein
MVFVVEKENVFHEVGTKGLKVNFSLHKVAEW